MNVLRLILAIGILTLFIAGCSTPEGGSSMPWSQPQDWEGKSDFFGEER